MKNNLPISQCERPLDAAKPVVTKTDLTGIITYANDTFVDVSGFSRDELIGVSHNIVRHPDMPEVAFADLWRTIQAGHPWRGIVKNRARNGDFYWVEAYVTPLTENGRITGYMSVRTPPTRADVENAEALYRDIREGRRSLPPTPTPPSLASAGRPIWAAAILAAGLAGAAPVVGGLAGVLCGCAAALAALATGMLTQTRLIAPLGEIDVAIRNIDEGQIGQRIAATGALSPLLDRIEALRIHLRAIFADVLVSSREVAERSCHVDRAMHDLLDAAAHQMDRVQQVAAAMQEMSVSIGEISSSTQQSLAAANRTERAADDGIANIATTIDGSTRIAEVVAGSKQKIGEVNDTVARISDISQAIKEIAAQTNLLALNAAIEAARAGEHGRGFAVVADEVRKLAEHTEASIGEISGVLGTIVASSDAAVGAMAQVEVTVGQNAAQVRSNGAVLEMICATSQESTRSSREITEMLAQQSTTSQDIAVNMEQISVSVESSNAGLAAIGEATGRLTATSVELRRLVAHMEGALGSRHADIRSH
jgi:aerotaxis receptor